jgi:hypothetical protein
VNHAPARRVLALLDDAALARSVIEMSSAVAHQLQRPLELVYVESTHALLAAALPSARVLAHGSGQWAPLAPEDVERAYRAQAKRLRELAERIAVRRSVSWSMRVMRGMLPQLALELCAQSDLMLVGFAPGAAALATMRPPRAPARPVIVAVADDSEPGQDALRLAQQVADALGGGLVVRPAQGGVAAVAASVGRCDLLVLPRTLVGPDELARLRQPALLVG